MVEPWDYRYLNSSANRQLESKIPAQSLLGANERFHRDLGADLGKLAVVFDLDPRPDKSPLAYTDFLKRGRVVGSRWQSPVARVVGTYPTGGLYSLNELVHESGHAVHVSAIHTRPAYMDWPDTLFTEAFADVSSWSVYERAWQQRYLGAEVPAATSLRSLFGDVMLDVSWALFELRMLRNPGADPMRSGPTSPAVTCASSRTRKCRGGPCACSSRQSRVHGELRPLVPCSRGDTRAHGRNRSGRSMRAIRGGTDG